MMDGASSPFRLQVRDSPAPALTAPPLNLNLNMDTQSQQPANYQQQQQQTRQAQPQFPHGAPAHSASGAAQLRHLQQDEWRRREATKASGYSLPEIASSEIVVQEVLGDGSYGTVYRGMCRQKPVAVKVLRGRIVEGLDEGMLRSFRHEVGVLSKIYHPNVCLFMGACFEPGKLMIVSELMKQDLETLLADQTVQLSTVQRMRIAKEAALGVLWLHSSNPQIIHRDLKTSNLLVDENLHAKVCDFGLSQLISRGSTERDGAEGARGTPLWMAPEVMRHDDFDVKCDCYSFALILWSLLTRLEPFLEFNDLKSFCQAVCLRHFRPAIPEDCDPTLQILIAKCWDPTPANRPSFDEIAVALDYIIVDTAVTDPNARDFWKLNFLQHTTASWSDFVDRLQTVTGAPASTADADLWLRCLERLVADVPSSGIKSGLSVDIAKFGQFADWFGPIAAPDFMGDVVSVLRAPWFHGDITAAESESRLFGKELGSFLVRFSSSSPGCFTVSKISTVDASIKHQKIQRHITLSPFPNGQPTGFVEVGGGVAGVTPGTGAPEAARRYASLNELVEGERDLLGLLVPCLGSSYLSLFSSGQHSAGYID